MAKAKNYISLCVAEYLDGNSGSTGWRIIADQMVPRSGEPYFEQAAGAVLHLPYKSPSIAEVGVFDWAEGRKLASGELDVRPLSRIPVYEVVEPREFTGILMENEAQVRKILKSGFSVPEAVKSSFLKGQTALALVIPSDTGFRRALVIRDKSKVSFTRTDEYYNGCNRAVIEEKPEDPKRFIESIDIIQIDGIHQVSYKFASTSCYTRKFLSKEAPVVKKLIPYSPEEFAPVVLKRILSMAAKNYQLSSGRKLTKADVAEIFSCMDESLKSESSYGETLRLSDKKMAKQVAEGIRSMLPKIKEDVQQDGKALADIRALLFSDETIRAACVQQGREEWLSENSGEVKEKEKVLSALAQEVQAASSKKESLMKSCDMLEKRIEDLEKDLASKDAATKKVSAHLQSAIENYRHNLSQLIMDTGCSSGNLPFTIPGGQPIPLEESSLALIRNLSQSFVPEDAKSAAAFLEYVLPNGFHLGAPGEYAALLANALSVAQEGRSAAVVVRADNECSFVELQRAVVQADTQVVLVEGVLGCEQDFKTLALARHCPIGKILVFSIDDAYNKDKISSTVFSRIAMVDTLQPAVPGVPKPMQKLDKAMLRPVAFMPVANWTRTGNRGADAFIEHQKELMAG